MKTLTNIVLAVIICATLVFIAVKADKWLDQEPVVTVKIDSTAHWALLEAVDSLKYLKTRVDSFETTARVRKWSKEPAIVAPVPAGESDAWHIIDSLTWKLNYLYTSEFSRDTVFVVGDSVATVDLSTGFRFWPTPVFRDVAKYDLKKILVKEVRTETVIDRTRNISLGVGVGYGLRGPDVHIGIYYQLWGIR